MTKILKEKRYTMIVEGFGDDIKVTVREQESLHDESVRHLEEVFDIKPALAKEIIDYLDALRSNRGV